MCHLARASPFQKLITVHVHGDSSAATSQVLVYVHGYSSAVCISTRILRLVYDDTHNCGLCHCSSRDIVRRSRRLRASVPSRPEYVLRYVVPLLILRNCCDSRAKYSWYEEQCEAPGIPTDTDCEMAHSILRSMTEQHGDRSHGS